MYICGYDILMLNSKLYNFVTSWYLIRIPHDFVQGSFPIKLTKYAIKTGVKFWLQLPFKGYAQRIFSVFLSLKIRISGTRKKIFVSQDMQILKFSWHHKCLRKKQEIHFTRRWTQSGNEMWPLYVILQNESFHEQILAKVRARH